MTRRRLGALPAGAGRVSCLDCGATAAADGKGNPIVLRHEESCPSYTKPRKQIDPTRCRVTHYVAVWPYTARCTKEVNHEDPYEHQDRYGNTWHYEPCDGCRLIERKRDSFPPSDQEAHDELRSLERKHLRECPNGT